MPIVNAVFQLVASFCHFLTSSPTNQTIVKTFVVFPYYWYVSYIHILSHLPGSLSAVDWSVFLPCKFICLWLLNIHWTSDLRWNDSHSVICNLSALIMGSQFVYRFAFVQACKNGTSETVFASFELAICGSWFGAFVSRTACRRRSSELVGLPFLSDQLFLTFYASQMLLIGKRSSTMIDYLGLCWVSWCTGVVDHCDIVVV